ncbi:hypothetical protein [Rhodococcus sp. 077-4]|uniref:hypothetical protein n=1 Tax=Rhodococcus sp. 077-4 TaxID=2789271 RepID=UPI0039F5D70C
MAEGTTRVTRRRPGIGTASATVVFLALLAGNRFEWWDYRPPWNLFLDLVIVWLAVAGLIVVGVVWAYRLHRYLTSNRHWPWPSVIAPLLIVAAAVAFVAIDRPVDQDFDRARTHMESLAESMLNRHIQRIGSIRISDVSLSPVRVESDNCVSFTDSKRSNTLSRSGWLYTARCTPDPRHYGPLVQVAPGWMTYSQRGT